MKKETTYRAPKSGNLFEDDFTIEALNKLGNPLEQLSALVDFEMFRPTLEDVLLTKEVKSPAGRKPIDVVLLFKVIFLQRFYGLSDHNIEYQILDRISFRQFLGIHTYAEVPDEKTVWLCKDTLAKAGKFDALFDDFRSFLDDKGLRFNEGKIIDASFVEAPRQRNTREENKRIKEGKGSELWNAEDSDSEQEKKRKKNKKRHKDIDAQWTQKRGENHFGYKSNVKADKRTKLIETYQGTPANVHDSNVIEPLIEESDKGQPLFLDAGYAGREDVVTKAGMIPIICERNYRNKPLTDVQIANNRQKSKTRCRVEHIFGFIEQAMHGSFARSIGLVRAKANIALTCLVYNVFRYMQIVKYHHQLIAIKG